MAYLFTSESVSKVDPMNQGAGDQGMMFGYATNETDNYMPLALDLAHLLLMELADIRREGTIPYLRPDAKSQVTIEYLSLIHISEPTRRTPISYAVFCLKKKKNHKKNEK